MRRDPDEKQFNIRVPTTLYRAFMSVMAFKGQNASEWIRNRMKKKVEKEVKR